jgi:hypothetical protein
MQNDLPGETLGQKYFGLLRGKKPAWIRPIEKWIGDLILNEVVYLCRN